MYGGFTSNVDMTLGRAGLRHAGIYAGRAWPAASWRAAIGCPYRSSNVSAANAVDAQAAYEIAMSLWGAVMGGANMVMHARGLDGGRARPPRSRS